MSNIRISRQLVLSQSIAHQKKNNSFDKNSISFQNIKLNNNNCTINNIKEKKYHKIFFNQLFNNKSDKVNVTKLIKYNENKTKEDFIKETPINKYKKIRCSSMEYNNNIPQKNISNNSLFKKENKLSMIINVNKNIEKKNEIKENKKKLIKKCQNENLENKKKQIKKIQNTLNSRLSSIDTKKNKSTIINLIQTYTAYNTAFNEYIKLLSLNEEINLLNSIKLGFSNLFNKYNQLNQKINKKEKKSEENSSSKKSTNYKETISTIISIKDRKTMPIIINRKSNSNSHSQDDKNSFEKMNKTCLNPISRINKSNEIDDDDNINLTDLESVRFCDKISMRLIQPYKAIPKLDLSSFTSKNNLKKSNLNNKTNLNISNKKKEKKNKQFNI